MALPFSTEQFFEVLRQYNTSVWPALDPLTGLGLLAAYLAFRPRPGSDRLVAGILAALWAWMGAVYHLRFFRAINPAALWSGLAFVIQAILLLRHGVLRPGLRFRASRSPAGLIGGLLLVYAFALYPVVARSFGHLYPASPTFGLPPPSRRSAFFFG